MGDSAYFAFAWFGSRFFAGYRDTEFFCQCSRAEIAQGCSGFGHCQVDGQLEIFGDLEADPDIGLRCVIVRLNG